MTPRPDQVAKLGVLKEKMHRDAVDPIVVELASRLARPHRPDDWKGIAEEIFAFVRDGIRMQRDPDKQEEFAPAAVVIQRGWDDCDGKVSTAAALLRALGIEADIWPVYNADGILTHVQLAVRWPLSERYGEKSYNHNGWVIGELTIRNAKLGHDPREVPRNPDTNALPFSGGPGREKQ